MDLPSRWPAGWRLASLAVAIGFVTQESYLFHDTILANIRYGRPSASMEEVQEAARAAS